ncbi:hypothetical protein N0V95_005416 [Ascochyta clinopodiicola]|nr:hypothetical protein N0V95_005416 [Ascochyta clinopodiicola]
MSFGISPSDILKLLEISTKVYIAFKNANENSEAQVEGLVRELETFNRSLNDLRELMIEYGRPLPLPYQEFRETVQKCDTCIQSFVDKLIDKKMGFTKVMYTFKYMGKEKEIDGLRKQISLHCQSLQLCISSLQLYAIATGGNEANPTPSHSNTKTINAIQKPG